MTREWVVRNGGGRWEERPDQSYFDSADEENWEERATFPPPKRGTAVLTKCGCSTCAFDGGYWHDDDGNPYWSLAEALKAVS